MTTTRLAIIAALCGSACVTDEREVVPTVMWTDEASTNVTPALAPDQGAEGATDDMCALLPPDGPCALACDTGALATEYVPAGTCAVFGCVLADGRSVAVHACHPAD